MSEADAVRKTRGEALEDLSAAAVDDGINLLDNDVCAGVGIDDKIGH